MRKQLNQRQKMFRSLIISCINKEITTKEAAMRVGCVRRTIQKTIVRYKEVGDAAFIHGNTGRKRVTKESEALQNNILHIFNNTRIKDKNPFENITYMFFTRILKDYFNIDKSVSYVKKVLNSSGYKTPIKHKVRNQNVHLMRERKESMGELVQADGTPFDWFGNNKINCIQGFIDDATGYPVGLYMTKNECMLGYVEAFRNMATAEGLPVCIYPDKSSIFFVNQKMEKDEEKPLTQFGVMMENLGIEMIPAHSPQAKGRIERFWQTIQKRLPHIFIMRGIDTIEKANEFLRDEFPKIYKRWFPVMPRNDESCFIKANIDEINTILKANYPGKIDKGGVFSFQGYKFFCPHVFNQKIIIHLNEQKGLWISDCRTGAEYDVTLLETDTTGRMPEVTKLLIEKVFLKNAKAKYREVYFEVDSVLLSEIKRKKTA